MPLSSVAARLSLCVLCSQSICPPMLLLVFLGSDTGLPGIRAAESQSQHGCISGLLYGTMTLELGGKVTIACEKNNLQVELDFKLKVVGTAWGRQAWSSGHGRSKSLGDPSVLQGRFSKHCT